MTNLNKHLLDCLNEMREYCSEVEHLQKAIDELVKIVEMNPKMCVITQYADGILSDSLEGYEDFMKKTMKKDLGKFITDRLEVSKSEGYFRVECLVGNMKEVDVND